MLAGRSVLGKYLHPARGLSDGFMKERHIFPAHSLGRRTATFSKYLKIQKVRYCAASGNSAWTCYLQDQNHISRSQGGKKNKDPKKVHCAAVAEKRNSILQSEWLGGGDGMMAKQKNPAEKLSALREMSSPSLKNTLNCPDLTGPFLTPFLGLEAQQSVL